jgi:hypothetical protein
MASYSSPTPAAVIRWTGLNSLIDGVTSTAFQAALRDLIADVEVETALAVTESVFDSTTLTDRKVSALKQAVGYRTAARALDVAWLQVATGTHEPLLMDADAIAEAVDRFTAKAQELEALATAGTETSAEERPFALPSVSSSTFTTSSADRTPSERLAALDESDDVSVYDEEA